MLRAFFGIRTRIICYAAIIKWVIAPMNCYVVSQNEVKFNKIYLLVQNKPFKYRVRSVTFFIVKYIPSIRFIHLIQTFQAVSAR